MLEDNQIISQVIAGNIEAYRHLVDKYRDMTYTIALKLMKQDYLAEEVAQESFIKAYEKLRSFKGESSFSTWLYTIVYRTAIYHLRKQSPLSLTSDSLPEQTNNSNAESRIMANEEKQRVRHAINQLPRLEGMLVTLYYMDEKSIAEIATITALTKANVKVKLFRARKRLKHILAPILSHE